MPTYGQTAEQAKAAVERAAAREEKAVHWTAREDLGCLTSAAETRLSLAEKYGTTLPSIVAVTEISNKIAAQIVAERGLSDSTIKKLKRAARGQTVKLTSKEIDEIEEREGFREGWMDVDGKQVVIYASGNATRL